MMGKKDSAERTQMEIASLEDLVPRNHLVRKLEDGSISVLFMMK